MLPLQGCIEEPAVDVPEENSMDNSIGNSGGIKEIPLHIDFKLSGIEEKSLSSPVSKGDACINDSLLEDVNLYVVDENGELVYHKYGEGNMEFEVVAHDKMHYSVYAIANAGKKMKAANAEEIELLSYSIPDISYIKSKGGAVLMSGKTEPQLLDSTTAITVYLTRCIAKVNLKADYSQLNSDVEININSVELKNIPSGTTIFKENKILSPYSSITGDIKYNLTAKELSGGIEFYQFENMQGTLQPDNESQQDKVWPPSSLYSQICSYVEIQASYKSPRKQGNIFYRFYLGNDMLTNYDVKRNTQMNITVNFKGDGAVEENTWRVDNSEIKDMVTDIDIVPQSHTFTEFGESLQLTATVTPATAYNSAVKWSSSNGAVAEVDANGRVTSIDNGECVIYATSTDGTEISASCNITVDVKDPAILHFASSLENMYDGQRITLPFSTVYTAGQSITANSGDGNIVKIVSVSEGGIQIEALAPGETVVTANIGNETATSCRIKVEKLMIKAAQTALETHNHFYADLEYSISPDFAAKDFTVNITSDASGISAGFGGIPNRIIPQYLSSAQLPATAKVTLSLNGRPDIFAEVSVTVKPMLEMVSEMKINANMGNKSVEKDLGLVYHPRGNVNFRWTTADGKKYYGDPGGSNAQINSNTITFPIPNSANGLYRLEASVTGDDGYGSSGEPDATGYCEIKVYETVYLVGISKTIDRNKVEGSTDTWEYENEIVAKWLSHPHSLLYPQGELFLELGFLYNGITYTNNDTGETEVFTFSFEKGETIQIMLEDEGMTYNGNPPIYYMEFFSLEPTGNKYRDGNPATGEPYLYIYSRNFISGFTRDASPDWKKIFKIIYP